MVAAVASPLAGQADSGTHVRSDVVSGAPELKRTDGGELKRWHKEDVTVHIDSSVDVVGRGAREAVIAALGAWQVNSTHMPRLTVGTATGTTASTARDGQNTVLVAPIDIPGHRNDLAVTVSHWDEVTGEILEADIIINAHHVIRVLDSDAEAIAQSSVTPENDPDRDRDDEDSRDGSHVDDHDESWNEQDRSDHPNAAHVAQGSHEPDDEISEIASCGGSGHDTASCGRSYDLQSIVAHEVGHFYGLGEDRDNSHATMYFCTSACETHKRSLSDSDAEAVGEVYSEAPSDGPEIQCSVGVAGTPNRRLPLPWLGGALLGMALLLRRRAAGAH